VRPGSLPSKVVMPAFLFAAMHLLTLRTPFGRRFYTRVKGHGAPVIRVKPGDLAAAGVQRVARVTGVRDGRPALEDGTSLDVANVVWCTRFRPDYSWIDVPACAAGMPPHERGVVRDEPGLYLVGQLFQYALASTFIAGVGRDARHIAKVIARRAKEAHEAPRRTASVTAGEGTR